MMRWMIPLLPMVACGGKTISPAPSFGGENATPAEETSTETVAAEASPAPSPESLSAARIQVELGTSLDASMRAVLSTEAKHFRACYASALDRNPILHGEMTFDVSLSDGRPETERAVTVDGVGDWRLAACVERAVQNWAVPGAGDQTLAFVVTFSTRRA